MKSKYLILTFLVSSLLIIACKKTTTGNFASYDDTPYALNIVNNTLPAPNLPSDNPMTKAKVELGRMLFYEKSMSSDGTVSCASCHHQATGFSDPNQFSIGVNGATGGRQAMGIINMAWNENEFFWDGRAHFLRDQSLGPIENPLEMNETLENVIVKLKSNQSIRQQFIRAFGTPEITAEKMSLAMENFMMALVSDDSKYDRYLVGTAVLTASEERGRALFFEEYNEFFPDLSGADCAHCHSGANFENDLYMNNGLDLTSQFVDFGREDATANPTDRAKFKVPTLRNIEVTGPYMHDGRFQTLEEVVNQYDHGVKNSTTVDPAVLATTATGLMLDDQDKIDLINFMKTLTDYTFLSNTEYSDPN